MSQFYKNIALWMVIGLVMVGLFQTFNPAKKSSSEIIYSDFLREVSNGQISEVTIQGNHIKGRYLSGGLFQTFAPKDSSLINILTEKKLGSKFILLKKTLGIQICS